MPPAFNLSHDQTLHFNLPPEGSKTLDGALTQIKRPHNLYGFLVFKEQKSLTQVQGMNKYILFAKLQANIYFFLMVNCNPQDGLFFKIIFDYLQSYQSVIRNTRQAGNKSVFEFFQIQAAIPTNHDQFRFLLMRAIADHPVCYPRSYQVKRRQT